MVSQGKHLQSLRHPLEDLCNLEFLDTDTIRVHIESVGSSLGLALYLGRVRYNPYGIHKNPSGVYEESTRIHIACIVITSAPYNLYIYTYA